MKVSINYNIEMRKKIEEIVLIPDADAWKLYLPEISSNKISLIKGQDYSSKDCIDYALGVGINCFDVGCLNILPEVTEPQKGDVVLYLRYKKEKDKIVHAGILQKDKTIISRWGPGGPIFNHPIDFVPQSYGDFVTFHRI